MEGSRAEIADAEKGADTKGAEAKGVEEAEATGVVEAEEAKVVRRVEGGVGEQGEDRTRFGRPRQSQQMRFAFPRSWTLKQHDAPGR